MILALWGLVFDKPTCIHKPACAIVLDELPAKVLSRSRCAFVSSRAMLCFSGKDDDIVPALSFLKQFVLMRSSASAEPPASRVAACGCQMVRRRSASGVQ